MLAIQIQAAPLCLPRWQMTLVILPQVLGHRFLYPARPVFCAEQKAASLLRLTFESAAPSREFNKPARPKRRHAKQLRVEQHCRGFLLGSDLDRDPFRCDLVSEFRNLERRAVKWTEIHVIPWKTRRLLAPCTLTKDNGD